jgi:hypothetical protein
MLRRPIMQLTVVVIRYNTRLLFYLLHMQFYNNTQLNILITTDVINLVCIGLRRPRIRLTNSFAIPHVANKRNPASVIANSTS